MEGKIRVGLLLENRLLRESLARILKKRSDLDVAFADPPSEQTRAAIGTSRADILLLDWTSRTLQHLCVLAEGRGRSSTPRLIVIGIDDTERIFMQAIRRGVVGFVLKEASALDIVSAIRTIASGEVVCPPRLCRFLFEFVRRRCATTVWDPSASNLTRREQQLVPMIARGLTNKEIAAECNLSEQTVKNHIHRMLDKLGAGDRVEIANLYRTSNLPV